MRQRGIGLLAVMALLAAPACAQVYAGRSGDGTVVLASFRGNEAPDLLIPAVRPGAASGQSLAPRGVDAAQRQRARQYDGLVLGIAQEANVPVQLLHAVIAVESAYVPSAVSPRGAMGLMQLMPSTAKRFGVTDPFDASDNVRGGAQYLRWLLDRFGGDLTLAVAGYNAGEDAVVRAGYRIPPYAETQRYVPRVLARVRGGGSG